MLLRRSNPTGGFTAKLVGFGPSKDDDFTPDEVSCLGSAGLLNDLFRSQRSSFIGQEKISLVKIASTSKLLSRSQKETLIVLGNHDDENASHSRQSAQSDISDCSPSPQHQNDNNLERSNDSVSRIRNGLLSQAKEFNSRFVTNHQFWLLDDSF